MDLQIDVEVMLNQLGVGTGGKIMIDELFQMTEIACRMPRSVKGRLGHILGIFIATYRHLKRILLLHEPL